MTDDDKPSIITFVQKETAIFADCYFVHDALMNNETVTGFAFESLYSDGIYQSPENREYAKGHNDM